MGAGDQGRTAALAALLFAVPLQLVASVFGFLSRDPVAGTGMGVLSGTWAVTGVVRTVLPLWRRGAAAAALHGNVDGSRVDREAGVREQL